VTKKYDQEHSEASKNQESPDYPTHPDIKFTTAFKPGSNDGWDTVRRRVSCADDAMRLLKRQPAERLQLQSTLVFHSKGIEARLNVPGETRAAAEIWDDNKCMEGFHVRGRLAWCDSIDQSESKSERWTQWQEWLATAGMLLDFVDTPLGCTESTDLRLIPNPLRRWIYLLHEFGSSSVFTWDMSPIQVEAWWRLCEHLGRGHYYHNVGDEWVLGAAAGERLPLDDICTVNKLPMNFHVCSEIRDVIYESEKLLDVLTSAPGGSSTDQQATEKGYVKEPLDITAYKAASEIRSEFRSVESTDGRKTKSPPSGAEGAVPPKTVSATAATRNSKLKTTTLELVKRILCLHHLPKDGTVNCTPLSNRDIADKSSGVFKHSTARRYLGHLFGDVDEYKRQCNAGTIDVSVRAFTDGLRSLGTLNPQKIAEMYDSEGQTTRTGRKSKPVADDD
jgi:hypothetical protein